MHYWQDTKCNANILTESALKSYMQVFSKFMGKMLKASAASCLWGHQVLTAELCCAAWTAPQP